jgi:hypothetical protein
MPDVTGTQPEFEESLLTVEQAGSAARGSPLRSTLEWLDSYLVKPHPDLGRPGVVCPFTRSAQTLDTLRFAINCCADTDEREAIAAIRQGFAALKKMHAPGGDEHFRAIIMLFPNCTGPSGIETLERAMKRFKYSSLLTLRTIGFLHANSTQPGVWNPAFCPMTAPVPLIVLRYVVLQDARFVAHHHLSWAPFVLRYGIQGAKRLFAGRRSA